MRLIILGKNGMLGAYATKFFQNKYEILSFERKDLDFTKQSQLSLKNFFDELCKEDDIVLNCAGAIKQRNYTNSEMILVNSVIPNVLAETKLRKGCQVIHITTDCVFSGDKGGYTEKDNHDAEDGYGKTKSLGENLLNTNIRTSIIGEEYLNKLSLLEWVKSNSQKEIYGYTNHYWNGMTCLELCKLVDKIIYSEDFWKGTRHFFSNRVVSKFELCNLINKEYFLNINIIPKETETNCFRNLSSLYDIKYEISDLEQQIKELKNYLNQ